jgi:hypothetical protein
MAAMRVIYQPKARVLVEFPFMDERPTLHRKTGAAFRAIADLLGQFSPAERATILLNLCSTEGERP